VTAAVRRDAADILDRAWDISPRVSIRPERFGALLYHFGTRRLSFLKDRRLLDVVQRLPQHATARAACTAAGLTDAELAPYARALSTLAATDMLQERA
jgi:putative mycofactocin binding protein MftB